jgi:site-specific DNA-methyltransferase (adenine-specific)
MSIELHLGDCLEIMKNLPDKSIDLFLCDLPYGCLSVNGKSKISEEKAKAIWGEWAKDKLQSYGAGCSWDVKLNLEEFWKQVKRLAKNDNTPVIHFCTTKFGIELINSNPSWFRYDLVWDKQRGVSFLSANKMPMRSHEMIYVFAKQGAYYNRVDISGDFKGWSVKREDIPSEKSLQYGGAKRKNTSGGDGKRCVLSVISEMGGNRKTNGHPTEKQLELYKWLIERYCPAGGTVLDPTAGSGNVGFACWELERNCILIEKDATFHKKISDRLDTL